MNGLVWFGVALLGGLGALLRFFVDAVIGSRVGRDLPYGTLIVNLTGAVVLGFLTGLTVSGEVGVLAGTAAVGSYTTFSTWMLESHRLVEAGELRNATANITLSIALGIGTAALGRTLGAHW